MRINLRTSFVVTVILLNLILAHSPQQLFASDETCLKITEVYAAPASGEHEWVEIWNCGKTSLDLTNYQLLDQVSTPTNIANLACIIVQPNGYVAIDLPTAKLNNTGDGVTLLNYDQEVIDQMSYSATKTQYSWALVSNELEQFWILALPSRGLPNPFPTPTPSILPTSPPVPTITPAFNPASTSTPSPTAPPANTPPVPTPTTAPTTTPTHIPIDKSQLKLAELVACPIEGETEWLELYWSGTENLEFANWKIQDKSDNQVFVSGTLVAKQYTVFSWSKSLFNNTGDELFLYDQNDQELVHLILPGCQAGQSYSLIDHEYLLTRLITKGSANQYYPTITPSLSASPTASPTPTVHQTTAKQVVTPSVLGIATSSAQTTQNQIGHLSQYNPALPQLNDLTKTSSVDNTDHNADIRLTESQPKINWSLLAVIMGCLITIGTSLFILYEQKKSDCCFIL